MGSLARADSVLRSARHRRSDRAGALWALGADRPGGSRLQRGRPGLGGHRRPLRGRAAAPVGAASRADGKAVRDQPHRPPIRRGRVRSDPRDRAGGDLFPHGRPARPDRAGPRRRCALDPAGRRPAHGRAGAGGGRGRAGCTRLGGRGPRRLGGDDGARAAGRGSRRGRPGARRRGHRGRARRGGGARARRAGCAGGNALPRQHRDGHRSGLEGADRGCRRDRGGEGAVERARAASVHARAATGARTGAARPAYPADRSAGVRPRSGGWEERRAGPRGRRARRRRSRPAAVHRPVGWARP